MKSLLAKILLALLASTLLALLVASGLSRAALQHDFLRFLEQQEERQLLLLAPELAAFYRRHGGWAPLVADPRSWMRLLARSRPEGIRPPENAAPESGDRPVPGAWWLRFRPGRGHERAHAEVHHHLWRRLFVLDAQQEWLAGARYDGLGGARLVPIEADGRTVGWVGFHPSAVAAAPEARRFLAYHRRSLMIALAVALVLAGGLGFWLARSLARPVGRVRETVTALTAGDFGARTGMHRRDEIGDLAGHVDRLAETLERNRSARRRWTAEIAHELRTPLAILRGELEAIRDGIRPLEGASLDSLHEEVSQLSRLVDDLQTLALADAGALEFHFEELELGALVRQVLDAFAERLAARGLKLESRLPQRLSLRADPQRLRQVLENLLENSCRYTSSGGTIRVTLSRADDRALLDIEDSAPAVPEQQRERLFDRFYRGEPSRGRSGGGSGLGLAICREIVVAHGGDIEARDSALGGLWIRIRLPLGA